MTEMILNLMPVLVIPCGAIVVLLISSWWKRANSEFLLVLGLATLAATIWFAWSAFLGPVAGTGTLEPWNHGTWNLKLGTFFTFDHLSLLGIIILSVSTAIALVASLNYITERCAPFGEYVTLMLFAALGAAIMVSSQNLIIVFIGLEILSIASYVLAGYNSKGAASVEASVKYFTLGAISSAIFIFGIAFFYGATGGLDIIVVAEGFSLPPIGGTLKGSTAYLLAMALILTGLSFKAALVPFQWWVADVYQGAPLPVTNFFATTVKIAAFVLFIRIMGASLVEAMGPASTVLGVSFSPKLTGAVAIMAVATMTFGNLAALFQENVKRMLAYSSIAHAGYLTIALLCAGANMQLASASLLFYLLAYVLMTAGAFAVLIYLGSSPPLPSGERAGVRGTEKTYLSDISGLGRKSPYLAAAFAAFMLALAGIPPMSGFFAKFFIFKTAIQSGWTWLVIVAVLNSLVSVYYYMRPVVSMYFGGAEDKKLAGPEEAENYSVIGVIIFCLISTILLGLFPNTILLILGR